VIGERGKGGRNEGRVKNTGVCMFVGSLFFCWVRGTSGTGYKGTGEKSGERGILGKRGEKKCETAHNEHITLGG